MTAKEIEQSKRDHFYLRHVISWDVQESTPSRLVMRSRFREGRAIMSVEPYDLAEREWVKP